jgi:NAD(P)-dependent dehydrogenase (short-subunit alcohol dehydrogenase family)
MTALTDRATAVREPALLGQTVVVLGGSSGIGLETARSARTEGAQVVLTGRDPERLARAAADVGAARHAAFDAHDPDRLAAFLGSLPAPVDHIMVSAGGPYYAPLADMDVADACRHVADHLRLILEVARYAAGSVRPGGTLLFVSGTGARRPHVGIAVTALLTAGYPALAANLALELAPVRVNLVAPGFVDTPLSASLLGADLDERREQLRATLPIRRVVGPGDVAALAVHVMVNTALTGATFDVDGGQQVL